MKSFSDLTGSATCNSFCEHWVKLHAPLEVNLCNFDSSWWKSRWIPEKLVPHLPSLCNPYHVFYLKIICSNCHSFTYSFWCEENKLSKLRTLWEMGNISQIIYIMLICHQTSMTFTKMTSSLLGVHYFFWCCFLVIGAVSVCCIWDVCLFIKLLLFLSPTLPIAILRLFLL